MGMPRITADCPLCGSDAQVEIIDGGAEEHYFCTSAACGNFIMTDAAKERVAASEMMQQVLSTQAASQKAQGKTLAIRFDTAQDRLDVKVV
jgi:uncharacterized Zn finger protein